MINSLVEALDLEDMSFFISTSVCRNHILGVRFLKFKAVSNVERLTPAVKLVLLNLTVQR